MVEKVIKIKMKISKNDWKEILLDVLALQELAKIVWGEEIRYPEDFGLETLEWEYQLSRLVTHKNPKKLIKNLCESTGKTGEI